MNFWISIERALNDIETEVNSVPLDRNGGCLSNVHVVSGAEEA
jgi:hypothetical protein